MAIFKKFANIKIANINNYAHTHIDEETWEEKCGSSNCQYENCQLLLTDKFFKYYFHK